MSAVDAYKTYQREVDRAGYFMAHPAPRSLQSSLTECSWVRSKEMSMGMRYALEKVIESEHERLLARAMEHMRDTLARQRQAVKAECDEILNGASQ